jgi:phage minor structural protein
MNTARIQLEHVICTLKDDLLFGKTTAKDLGGGTKVAPATAIATILSNQSIWQLGECEYSTEQPYELTSVSLYSGIETICSAMTDYYWTFDTSSLPFTLNVLHRPTERTCEMREARNLSTLRMTVNKGNMFTRYYPVGAKNINIKSVNDGCPYVEKNVDLYGVIAKTDTDQTVKSPSILLAQAQALIERHSEPEVNVTISGFELSQATGEPLDRLTIGAVCGVPLHKYGTTISERIISLQWRDVVTDPQSVTVTLANRKEDAATIIAQMAKSGGGGRAAQAEEEEEDYAYLVDTNTQAGAIAKAVIGTDEDGNPNWSRVAQILASGNSMDAKISLVVKDIDGGDNTLNSASIIAGINDYADENKGSESYVNISADAINLNGYVTARDFNALKAKIDELFAGKAYISSLSVGGLKINGNSTKFASITSLEGTTYSALVRA